jgi:uncharacterized protein (TIGR02246 family)
MEEPMKTTPLRALLLLVAALPAAATDGDVAKAHSEEFARAFNARDAKAIVALYADDARIVWPGQGEEGKGKAEIAKLVDALLKSFPDSRLALKSQDAIAVGREYIATVGHWEQTVTTPDGKKAIVPIRTTEILRKSGKKALYVIDHASIGLPPQPGPNEAKTQ